MKVTKRRVIFKNLIQKLQTSEESFLPYLVAVNLTRACNLECGHCYMDAGSKTAASGNHIDFALLKKTLEEIAKRAPQTIIVLTGGEPMLYPHLEEAITLGTKQNLRMVLGTNGLGLSLDRAKRFKDLGLSGAGISIDSIDAKKHDEFRGITGAFTRSCRAFDACKAVGLHSQMHFTLMRNNLGEIEEAADLARNLGAGILNFFFLVCTGRGESSMDLNPTEYESALNAIAQLQENSQGLLIQARCAPHFKRILYQRNPDSPFTRASGYDGGGCPAGTHYCRITPQAELTPCPYMEESAGSLEGQSFWDLWDHSAVFQSFRKPQLEGRCSACEFQLLCGGCRARSIAAGKGLMHEDPTCAYEPVGKPPIPIAKKNNVQEAVWTPEAEERLKKIPIFLRPVVQKNLNILAQKTGETVTVELMAQYRSQREKELGIHFE